MTTLAEAYENAAEALAALAIAIRAEAAQNGAPAPVGPSRAAPPEAPSFDELPPDEWGPEAVHDPHEFEDTPQGRSGGCPVHDRPWTVQPGGFSAAKQKSYRAFWKCPATLPNGNFCPERPTLAWVKAHPPQELGA